VLDGPLEAVALHLLEAGQVLVDRASIASRYAAVGVAARPVALAFGVRVDALAGLQPARCRGRTRTCNLLFRR
jgi:hypothetical protein